MVEFWGLAVSVLIGAAAWLYQRAWERHERRVGAYQEIIDGLPAFTIGHLDPDRIDAVLSQLRRLWLLAPDDVIRAGDAFVGSIETRQPVDAKERALAEFILSMRREASFGAALVPRFFCTTLSAAEIKLRSARR